MSANNPFQPSLRINAELDATSEESASIGGLSQPSTSAQKAQPFVKWVGGKRSLLHEIEKYLPSEIGDYYEPFLGGAAVFFHIHERLARAHLSDSNLDLILAYHAVKKDVKKLIGQLKAHKRNHSELYYYKVRKQFVLRDPVKIAARLIYLNKTCYNGLYRVNKKGEFNVPIGNYKNPGIVQEGNLLSVNVALQKAIIMFQPYDQITAGPGDFVYFDPPYHSSNGNGFTSYTPGEFGEQEQTQLRDFALQLHQRGVKVMLSNANSDFIQKLYKVKPFKIRVVCAPRLVNSKSDGRNSVKEVLVTTYG